MQVMMADIKTILTDSGNGWSASTRILFSGDDEFPEATARWAIYKPPTYTACISPGTEGDVVKAVKLATKHNIHFLATCGRHGYSTAHGKLQNGLAIDLRRLNSIELNTTAQTGTVGGGVTTGEVLDPLFEAGFELPTGSCSATGLVGATLGGGIGRYSGIYGLLIDSLLSLRVVTAAGMVVEALATSEPDLFWGMRGAGANLGIVTSATYRMYRIADDPYSRGNVTNIDFILPAVMAPAYFDMLETNFGGDRMPRNLALVSIVMFDPERGVPQILGTWAYMGPEDDARRVIGPLLALEPPVIAIQNIPTNKLLHTAGFGFVPLVQRDSAIRSAYSANMRAISGPALLDAFEKMCALYEAHPDARASSIEMEHFPNQAMAAVPDEETAYPWRDARNNIICFFSWQDAESPAARAVADLGRQLRTSLSKAGGYDDDVVYVSYSQGDETLEQIYGRRKLPRLAALKKDWDPNNVFDYNVSLPAEYHR
ncbi:hypothetical protein FJTKL_02407 [Diaporthe vaccinii]|uniref:FAD-binding PCMH-type domain-containing protein n=1 Tax=Diaporthe vaccinii TaxID=105482 RepID=A0ABR4DYE7_9PEZI